MKPFSKVITTVLLICFITGIICTAAFAWYVTSYLDSSLNVDFNNLKLNYTSIIYGTDKKTGQPVEAERLYADENRIWVSIDKIPKNLQNAFIAIEDERFYQHHGVDWKRTIGAVINYVLPLGGSFGGSSITQQLVKNLTSEDEVRPDRKIKEILRALDIEKKYTKEEILEMYLNTIFLGNNLNGVQTAANAYFGKDVSQLTLAECASIAGITRYPVQYDPFLHPDKNKERQEVILNKMQDLGMITKQECDDAKSQQLVFNKEAANEAKTSKQSYFTDQVVEDVIADLVTQKKVSKQVATQMVYSGGLKIYSTMDPSVQKAMDEVYNDPNAFPKLKGTVQPESAMVIMDPYTGDVVGLVGGRGEKTGSRTLNRATQTYRQPGSAIKPVSVYAPAFEDDIITYATVLDDTPYDVEKLYPKNQNNRYQGRMTISRGVELSLNTMAVKVMSMLTPQASYDFLTQKLHVSSLIKSKTVAGKVVSDISIAPLALGGLTNGISVLELNAAYTPFVNQGMYSSPRTYTKVIDNTGKTILEKKPNISIAMSEQTSFIVRKILEGVVQNGTATSAKLKSGIPVAGKTGTTDSDYDRWFVGCTPYYIGTVWFGYDTQKEVSGVSYNPSLSIWKQVMDKVHTGLENKQFSAAPKGVVQAQYCIDSGGVPTNWCKADPRGNRIATGWFKQGTQPTEPCTVHVPVEICGVSNMLATEFCPEETKKTVALLNLPDRNLPSTVVVEDSQYVINASNTGTSSAGGLPDLKGANPMNQPCKIHTIATTLPPLTEPGTGETTGDISTDVNNGQ